MRWQRGPHDMTRAMAPAVATRMEMIELGTWRSNPINQSAGSMVTGKARFFDQKEVARS